MARISLTQAQTQQQIFTPQMQQALAMLHAPALELRAMIQKELAQNPVLEEEPNEGYPLAPEADPQIDSRIEALRRFDDDARTLYAVERHNKKITEEDEEKRQFFFDSLTESETLAEHLRQQLVTSTHDPEIRRAGEFIIGNLDEDGYLRATLQEVANDAKIPLEKAEKTLFLIQTFHPPGVAARNLQECLLVQLDRLGKSETLEAAIVAHHMDDLGHHRFQHIAKSLGVSQEEVKKAAQYIAKLDPRPGRPFHKEQPGHYVIPEVFVTKDEEGRWRVSINDEGLPRLRINNEYKDLLTESSQNAETRAYLREKIRSGKSLIQHLNQRQETIRKIATEIFRRQEDFLEHGISHLRPLTLAEVAAAIGVHETTVSRAIANKYVQTPQGLYDLKFFFTPGYRTAEGDISNTTVKEMLAEIIAAEDPRKPLSDEKIVKIFADKGIHLARRTVAKYRAELKILPTSLRRKR